MGHVKMGYSIKACPPNSPKGPNSSLACFTALKLTWILTHYTIFHRSWPCAPGTPQGQNAACAISPREQHGFRICKALYDDQGHHWRAHTKFQKSNRSSCRADLRYSSFCPPGPHPVGGVQMVRRPYLRTTVDDFSSETYLIVVSIVTDDDGTSFRTEIGNSGA